jgi:hypothetical protein
MDDTLLNLKYLSLEGRKVLFKTLNTNCHRVCSINGIVAEQPEKAVEKSL